MPRRRAGASQVVAGDRGAHGDRARCVPNTASSKVRSTITSRSGPRGGPGRAAAAEARHAEDGVEQVAEAAGAAERVEAAAGRAADTPASPNRS